MQVGDLVKAKQGSLQGWTDRGLIISIAGRKWLKVAWVDGTIQREHVDDVEVVSESR